MNGKEKKGPVPLGQDSRIRKVICDINDMSETPNKDADSSPMKDPETPIQHQGKTIVEFFVDTHLIS